MKITSIKIIFRGHTFTAHVLATEHSGFVEYHITPNDENLKDLYGTQSIAVYPGRPYQSSITSTDDDSKEYKRALIISLHKMIDEKY